MKFLIAFLLSFASVSFARPVETQSAHYIHNFGVLPVGSSRVVRYQFNSGPQYLEVVSEHLSYYGPFQVRNFCPRFMQPNTVCYIDFMFWPRFSGNYHGRYDLRFHNGEFMVMDLYGQTFR